MQQKFNNYFEAIVFSSKFLPPFVHPNQVCLKLLLLSPWSQIIYLRAHFLCPIQAKQSPTDTWWPSVVLQDCPSVVSTPKLCRRARSQKYFNWQTSKQAKLPKVEFYCQERVFSIISLGQTFWTAKDLPMILPHAHATFQFPHLQEEGLCCLKK